MENIEITVEEYRQLIEAQIKLVQVQEYLSEASYIEQNIINRLAGVKR